MSRASACAKRPGATYERSCALLARLGSGLGVSGRAEAASARRGGRGRAESGRAAKADRTMKVLGENLSLAKVPLTPETVVGASKTVMLLATLGLGVAAAVAFVLTGTRYIVPLAFLLAVVPVLAREAVRGYPASLAAKRAQSILKDSTAATNLMIMSLRHEPSVSKAMRFAMQREDEFTEELKASVWEVVMGKHSSFEEALQALGARWSRFSGDLKASLNAMVTAACESREEGKRRALDRASHAMISGAKRRIEEYALALSTPSMVIFGVGILLPLMVGSFLPMLSWDLWAGVEAGPDLGSSGGGTIVQTIFLMNILFPAIAVLVAMDAVQRHPLDVRPWRTDVPMEHSGLLVLAAAAAAACAAAVSLMFLSGHERALGLLLGTTCPVGAFLMAGGLRGMAGAGSSEGFEDALFKTGARMLEGENFESAMARASSELDGEEGVRLRALSLRTSIMGQGFAEGAGEQDVRGGLNALAGLQVVREAASKDELSAGLLAMDLANYLKDLNDLESTLKSRLRPTISMMRMTAHALGPLVLGITYSIYLSLSSLGAGDGGFSADALFLVLGLFLAEINAVVVFFVWGIEGGKGRRQLAYSLGSCIVLSELIYSATALLAS